VQYRAVGSGMGLRDLVNYHSSRLSHDLNLFVMTGATSTINRTRFDNAPGTSAGGAYIDHNTRVTLADYARLAFNWMNSVYGFFNCAHDKNGNLVDDGVMQYSWDYDSLP
jgi:hypothetical protein